MIRFHFYSRLKNTACAWIAGLTFLASSVLTQPAYAQSYNEVLPFFSALPNLRPTVKYALSTSVSITACLPEDQHSFVQRGIYKLFGQEPPHSRQSQGGSGVVVNRAEGLILTAAHVVEGAEHIHVRFPDRDGKIADIEAFLVAYDPVMDTAVLAVCPKQIFGLSEAQVHDSSIIDIGDWVFAVGDPIGLTQSVSLGIVSGQNRNQSVYNSNFTKSEMRTHLIQSDALTRPGSSGGPLFSDQGILVGIIIACNNGISFSVPIERAMLVVQAAQRAKITYHSILEEKEQKLSKKAY